MTNTPQTWQEYLIGKNIHSVYVRCQECNVWSCPGPIDPECGACSSKDVIVYYDEATVFKELSTAKNEGREQMKGEIINSLPKKEPLKPSDSHFDVQYIAVKDALIDSITSSISNLP